MSLANVRRWTMQVRFQTRPTQNCSESAKRPTGVVAHPHSAARRGIRCRTARRLRRSADRESFSAWWNGASECFRQFVLAGDVRKLVWTRSEVAVNYDAWLTYFSTTHFSKLNDWSKSIQQLNHCMSFVQISKYMCYTILYRRPRWLMFDSRSCGHMGIWIARMNRSVIRIYMTKMIGPYKNTCGVPNSNFVNDSTLCIHYGYTSKPIMIHPLIAQFINIIQSWPLNPVQNPAWHTTPCIQIRLNFGILAHKNESTTRPQNVLHGFADPTEKHNNVHPSASYKYSFRTFSLSFPRSFDMASANSCPHIHQQRTRSVFESVRS